jgi:hypothetical protein
MELETFFTKLYVVINDWYKGEWEEVLKREWKARSRLSDSEVLTVVVAGLGYRGAVNEVWCDGCKRTDGECSGTC